MSRFQAPRYRMRTGFYLDEDIKERLFQRAQWLQIPFTRLVERYCLEGLTRDELREELNCLIHTNRVDGDRSLNGKSAHGSQLGVSAVSQGKNGDEFMR